MITALYGLLYKTKNGKYHLFVYGCIKLFLNVYYPIYCILNRNNSYAEINKKVIVSLTTFPTRIDKVWLVIETLLRQTCKPSKIILWLADSQFNSIEKLPKRLRDQQKRGLEIKFCDDLRSHKKYYYSMLHYPDAIIITVDDDTFYPENLVQNLLDTHNKYPDAVCCYYAHMMVVEKGEIARYSRWISGADGYCEPSHYMVPIGCEGVLYPPGCLYEDVFDKKKIKELSPLADDLWLKAMASLNNVKAVKCFEKSIVFANIIDFKNINLHSINAGQNMNDKQLDNIITQYPKLLRIWN